VKNLVVDDLKSFTLAQKICFENYPVIGIATQIAGWLMEAKHLDVHIRLFRMDLKLVRREFYPDTYSSRHPCQEDLEVPKI
jgi:hypothetical protein